MDKTCVACNKKKPYIEYQASGRYRKYCRECRTEILESKDYCQKCYSLFNKGYYHKHAQTLKHKNNEHIF